jgi:DNA polymerase III delta subunit
MLYVLYGTDRKKIADEGHKLLDGLLKKRPGAEVFRLDDEQETLSRLAELLESIGLFESKHIVMLDFVLSYESVRELVAQRAKDMAESEHVFVVLEEKIDAKTKKVLEKHAAQMHAFDSKEEKEERFNIFALADAVARRDKKNAWVILQRALREDLAPEEIHGVLWWQIKTLLLVARGDTSSLKPFAVTKAKGALKNFSAGGLQKFSEQLLTIYHDSRASGPSLDIALEQFVLGL